MGSYTSVINDTENTMVNILLLIWVSLIRSTWNFQYIKYGVNMAAITIVGYITACLVSQSTGFCTA
jgi:hypothetical protein